jgi:hypothetical protein
MKSKCCNAEVKWIHFNTYCTKCRKFCESADKNNKENCENFYDGLTRVADKGEFKAIEKGEEKSK